MNGEEARRLDVLRSYSILDTPAEPNFDRVTALAATIFGLPICTLAFADRDRHWFKSKYGVDATEMPRRLSFCDQTIGGEGVFVVKDALEDSRFAQAPVVAGPPHLRFYAGAPLVTPSGSRIGTLCVLDTKPQLRFTRKKRAILTDLASTVVDLLEARARQIELRTMTDEIAQMARHDTLTGLPNRRRLQELMDRLTTPRHQSSTVALLYLDLDGFKAVNDTVGHAYGDAMLREVARRLMREVDDLGTVARLGGDEFAILMTDDAEASLAKALAEKLVLSLAEPFEIQGCSTRIGASIGLAVMDVGTELDSLLRHADEALYTAKRNGRGRVVIASGLIRAAA